MNADPVILNEELPKKYESYSSSVAPKTDTLDEPVIDTIVTSLTRRNAISPTFTRRSAPPSPALATTRRSPSSGISGDHS